METPVPPETLAAFDGDELRARVFWEKYALRGQDGTPVEPTPDRMWDRLAHELAAVEPEQGQREHWQREFRWLLGDFRFLPGGRIMHAVGQLPGWKAAPINCFVLPLRDDSLPAIYDLCREMAITFSRGGGVGIDLSPLRPRGAVVHNAARVSTGAVSFMETFSLVTGTIGQAGRRGALMITIPDDHPDVLEFCRIKRDRTSVRYANISVLVSDAFMRAAETDADWRLHFENREAGVRVERVIRARELWDELVRGARDWAEPGCLFIDTARRRGTTEYNGMRVLTTNPCAEEFLEPYGLCCLGSINLLRFVRQPFAELPPEENVDWTDLRRAVRAGIRFLDNVLTYADPHFPLEAQRDAARRTRRVGLGVTALGDMLAALGLRYDADEAITFAERLMELIKLEAYRGSADLAEEKGPFPAFEAGPHLAQEFFQNFPEELRQRIRAVGLRNAAVMTVPPVGSGSVLAGVTSGIEPIFARAYVRRSESLGQERFRVVHPLVALYFRSRGQALPDLGAADDAEGTLRGLLPTPFVTAHEIDPFQRVRMQAAVARHVDNAVSSTINLPQDVSVETVEKIYRRAWESGCKGITVYREGAREGVLLTEREAPARHPETPGPSARRPEEPLPAEARGPLVPRPERLAGPTYRIPTAFGTAFITVTELDDQPFEVFGRLGKGGTDAEAAAEAIGRMASILLRLRSAVPRLERLGLIAEQLERIGGSRSAGFGQDRVRSIPDAFAIAIRKYLADRTVPGAPPIAAARPTGTNLVGDFCPRCQQSALIEAGGCITCTVCGFKEC
ncbi:MAG TPA: adenosylcobalamin-dependent ribonucleoside-diphosphate reductase [bacterium]|nr:adenosylcobalamin-dependent ribonucleoside-diphosphate reductase [bacterium]